MGDVGEDRRVVGMEEAPRVGKNMVELVKLLREHPIEWS
jgi:hypothetical protein